MQPRFLAEMDEAFASRQHVILTLNTEDRFAFPQEGIPPSNLEYFLASRYARLGRRTLRLAPSQGARELAPGGRTSPAVAGLAGIEDPLALMNSVRSLLAGNEPWLILVLHAEKLAPSTVAGNAGQTGQGGLAWGEIFHSMALDDAIAMGPSRLALVTYSGLPEELLVHSRGFRMVEIGLPTTEEREAFLAFLETEVDASTGIGRRDPELSRDELVRLSAGMTLAGLESVYRAAAHRRIPLGREDIRLRKARLIRTMARDLLDVSEPAAGFEGVAGLSSAKSCLRELCVHITTGDPTVSQSLLFQGVPGCGKTHLAAALAKELGWPLLELRNVRDPFVGQSERNLERVIRICEELAPAVLLFDEVDQTIGQRGTGQSGDSGTSERMLARIFTWLGSLHLRGRMLFVATTNRPDLLDAALLDRFGLAIPFLKPGPEELDAMIPMLLARFGRGLVQGDQVAICELVAPAAPTGRELQEILIAAGLAADREANAVAAPVAARHVAQAMADHLPRGENSLELEFIALCALALTSRQSLLPWNDLSGLRPGAEVPAWLVQHGIVAGNGRMDVQALQRELDILRQQRQERRALR